MRVESVIKDKKIQGFHYLTKLLESTFRLSCSRICLYSFNFQIYKLDL